MMYAWGLWFHADDNDAQLDQIWRVICISRLSIIDLGGLVLSSWCGEECAPNEGAKPQPKTGQESCIH